jgi:hypothetical protein
MTLNELMQKVIAAYPDPDRIAAYWNPGTGKMNKTASGDTLAEFIVREISETFYPGLSDSLQVRYACTAIRDAISDLDATLTGLKENT